MSSRGTGSDVRLDLATCFRDAKRETGIRCTRCERYICTDCMRDAPVGYQCPECVREGSRSVRAARTVFGGRVHAAPAVTVVLITLNVLVYLGELAVPGSVSKSPTWATGWRVRTAATTPPSASPYRGTTRSGSLTAS